MISGFLECLKIFHPRRFEFIKDFNQTLEKLVFSKETVPIFIFVLSDSNEKSPSFHAKVLSKEILA